MAKKEVSTNDEATLTKKLEDEIKKVQLKEKEVKFKEDFLKDEQTKLDKKQKELGIKFEELANEKNQTIKDLNSEIVNLQEKKSEYNKQISNLELEKSKFELEKSREFANVSSIKEKEFLDQQIKIIKSSDELLEKFSHSLDSVRDSHFETVAKTLDSFAQTIESNVEGIDNVINSYNEKIKDIIREQADIAAQKAEIETERSLLERENYKFEKLENLVELKVKNKYEFLLKSNEEKSKEIEKLHDTNNDLQATIDELNKEVKLSELIDYKESMNSYNRKKQELDVLQSKYSIYTDEEMTFKLGKASKYDELLRKFNELKDKFEIEVQNKEILQRQLTMQEATKQQLDILKQANLANEKYGEVLQKKIDLLEESYDNVKDKKIANESIKASFKEFEDMEFDTAETRNEVNWLENIIKQSSESGYKFNQRLVYSFHTSLKAGDMTPLTVLAGVSGTGKSKLPQLYSKFGGIYFKSVAVQPDWDSPQSLFGYYNSIEKRFSATDVTRILTSMQANEIENDEDKPELDLSDRLCIILLDEMNLAYVELYFSDLLSKLEEKRGTNDKKYIELDLGASNSKFPICLTNNVLWVGTMNEDETTKTLSDKVIDRGNIISFPRPTKLISLPPTNTTIAQNAMINISVWEEWKKSSNNTLNDEINKKIETFLSCVEDINKALGEANRALGHRVWQSIEKYIKIHPMVCSWTNKKTFDELLELVFAEVLVSKVIPKLRGIENDGELADKCLKPIQEIISKNAPSLENDIKAAVESPLGVFTWTTSTYLEKDYPSN